MSRLGILNPGSLVGHELKQALARRRDLWREIELFELEAEDYATVSEVAGEAVVVKRIDDDSLARLDVLFVCPGDLPPPAELAGRLAGAATVVFVSLPQSPSEARPVVAGINLEQAVPGGLLVSPDAGAITLSHLLHPLAALGLSQAVAWVVQPASAGEQAGVDELLDQTRRVLAFETELPQEVFGRRLAHNLYPTAGAAPLAKSVVAALGGELRLSLETLQAAVFHSVAVSVHARCAAGTTADAVRQALAGHSFLELAADGTPPGPVEAAGADRVLVGEPRADPDSPGAFWLWAVADNLTLGGAGNALAIAEALAEPAG